MVFDDVGEDVHRPDELFLGDRAVVALMLFAHVPSPWVEWAQCAEDLDGRLSLREACDRARKLALRLLLP